jgi:F-box-like
MSLPVRPATIIELPNETLSAVFQDLPPPTLAVIARISNRFRGVAERLLYSSVCLTDTLSEASPLPNKTLRWCQSMHLRLHLVESTKRLQIRWQTNHTTPPSHHLNPACSRIADILRCLIYLESLEIFLAPAKYFARGPQDIQRIHPVERAIRGCQLPLLLYCSLGAEWTKGAQPYTGILTSFLVSTPALRHLKLADHHTGLSLPVDAVPHLSSFRGSANAAAVLLPGRPVQALSLIGQDYDVNHENLPRMTLTTVALRYLDLSAMSVRPQLLRSISIHLPTIETLRVKLALRHTLHYAFSGIVSSPLFFCEMSVAKI